MDRNTIFAIALSFLVFTLYSSWRAEQERQWAEANPTAVEAVEPAPAPGLHREAVAPPTPSPRNEATSRRPENEASQPEHVLTFENGLVRATLTTRGGGLRRWELLDYRQSTQANAPLVDLAPTSDDLPPGLAMPLAELGLGDLSLSDFHVVSSDDRHAVFELRQSGVTVRKRFEISPDTYALRLLVEVENGSEKEITPGFGVVWPAMVRPGSDFANESLFALHEGAITRTPLHGFGTAGVIGGLSGKTGAEIEQLEREVDYAGVDSHYFVAAMLSDRARDTNASFIPIRGGETAAVMLTTPGGAIPPGLSDRRELRVYAGPKEPERLAAFGGSLDHSVDLGYSWVAPLTRGFLWLLRASHALIPNYGIGIILLTVLVRLVTAPLTVRQMRSMKRMADLRPKMDVIQKKHADDRQKQSEEMMKLYREAGVNPLGGCLPILLQFPVFIGLYYALQSSIDLRQAPFVGWIDDLSAPETLFTMPGVDLPVRLLPIIMGVSMVLQQKLTPASPGMDPTQARMMSTIMPVMFTVMFYQFPSGLVLYWFVSNLLAIAHQAWINRPQPSAAKPIQ